MYPKEVHKFIRWSKLMVEGAQVGRERTKGKSTGSKGSPTQATRRRRKRRRRNRAKKEA